MSLISRIKTWVSGETLTASDLNAEFDNLADNIVQADATHKGMVELATNDETITGTDTERAVTPANITAKIDTDGTLAGNSDTRIPSQKAVKTFVNDTTALPVVDTTTIVKGSDDDTKQVRIEVDGLTTGTTRVLTMPDKDITPADKEEQAYTESPMIISGGEVTEGTNAGTFKVAALAALLRTTDSLTGELEKVTKTAEDNISITAADTTYFVCLNYNGGSPTISLSTSNPYDADKRNIPIGKVSKDSSDNVHYISGGFRFQDGVEKLHRRAKELRELELERGSTISYLATDKFTMETGVAYGGLNRYSLSAYNSDTTQFTMIYSDGGTGWTETDRNTIDCSHYDDGSGTLATIGNNKYGCHYVYKHIDDDHVYVVLGTDSYALAEAVTNAVIPPERPAHLDDFGCLIGCIIAPKNGGEFTKIVMITSQFFSGEEVANHANLSNLDYASSGHTGFAKSGTNDDITSMTGLDEIKTPDGENLKLYNFNAEGLSVRDDNVLLQTPGMIIPGIGMNIMKDSGRFSGDSLDPLEIHVTSFAASSWFTPHNSSSAWTEAGQFIFNNTDFGGSAGNMTQTTIDLINAMGRTGDNARYGVEFFIGKSTMGSGTSSAYGSRYRFVVNDVKAFTGLFNYTTWAFWIRVVGTDKDCLVRGQESFLWRDGVLTNEDTVITATDEWTYIVKSLKCSRGYDNAMPYIYSNEGTEIQIACPVALRGLFYPGIITSPLATI